MEPTMHSNDYTIIKSRLESGNFLKSTALARINALANDLAITQEEANELTYLATQYGSDVLPEDAMGRLAAVEQTTDELTLLMADMIGGATV